ncbi:acetylserotonin O-methyltransferase [Heterocephalus glaber]|uniref:Acetylserotonin O-methyltransferase n=1 Tax=Heterocephalus glaber TaxID=10181 RepID=A0AAX6S0L7_HETGA|nr:acetylserotonin O-methyltransferase [Heterocephalus glaber]
MAQLKTPRKEDSRAAADSGQDGGRRALLAACELGVFHVLAEAPGPLDLGAVTTRLGTSSHGTELLLDACVSLKLLTVEMRTAEAFYGNTELPCTYLTSFGPKSQCHMLLYLSRTTYRCWGHLAEAVREGKNQYEKAFGIPSHDLFTAIYRVGMWDSVSDRFLVAKVHGRQAGFPMFVGCSPDPTHRARGSSPCPICPIPGGSGALAGECTSLYPDAKVIVFDTPDVVRTVKKHFPVPAEGQIGFQEGDFFRDPLPEADLYILARVPQDWADPKCSALLARVHRTCRPGGGVLAIERVPDEDRQGPLSTLLFSLNMLLQTEGRERSTSQCCARLSSAGFGGFQLKKTGGFYDAMLARK